MRCLVLAALVLAPQDADQRVRQLTDDSPQVRDEAGRVLGEMGEKALPALRRASRDPDPELRARVDRLLRILEWDPVMDPALLARYEGLREAFEIGDHERVMDFAKKRRTGIVGYRGDFEAYAIRLLDHPEVRIRKSALDLLGAGLGLPRRPIATLVREISRWNQTGFDDAGGYYLSRLASRVYALGSSLDRGLLAETHAADPEAEDILEVLRIRHGVPGLEPSLLRLLNSPSRNVSWLALNCVQDLRIHAARPEILKNLRRADPVDPLVEVVIAIEDDTCRQAYRELWQGTPVEKRTSGLVRLLARSGAPDVPTILLELLEKGPPDIRYAAASGLAQHHDHEAVDRLLSPSVPSELKSYFIQMAANIVDASDVGKLVEHLGEAEENLRNQVRWMLITLPDPGAKRRLVDLLGTETRPLLRDRLFEVICAAGSISDPPLLDAIPEEVLESLVRSGDSQAGAPPAVMLLKRKGRGAVPVLEDALLTLGEKRSFLLPLLLESPSERIAHAATEWLAGPSAHAVIPYLEKAGTKEAVAALERAARSLTEWSAKEAAVAAVARLKGEPPPKGMNERILEGLPWLSWMDPVALDMPGAREGLRKKVAVEGPSRYLRALASWAHPEMIPKLLEGLQFWDSGLKERVAKEGIPGPCLISGDEIYGSHWMAALVATGDRSLEEFFITRLADPDEGVRQVAITTVGKWRLPKADPILRRLVRSGDPDTRAEALAALARLGTAGTREFILDHLRDNPYAGSHALARLGAREAIPAVARLLEDPCPKASILSALDLLSHPEIYAPLDRPIPPVQAGQSRDLFQQFQETLNVPVRVTAPGPPNLSVSLDGTFRGSLECLTGARRYLLQDLQVTHVFRNGAVEFCTVPDALSYWKDRLSR